MTSAGRTASAAVQEALRLLDVDRLLLALPDRCFPSAADEDTGIGSTGTHAAEQLLRLVGGLGFTGVQLGPQGETSPADASPYTGTIFSRSRLGIALARLAEPGPWEGLLGRDAVARIVGGRPAGRDDRVAYDYACRVHRDALADAFLAFSRDGGPHTPALVARLGGFVAQHRAWLERDALYQALADAYDGADWTRWPDRLARAAWTGDAEAVRHREVLQRRHASAIARHAFAQLVAHGEHDAFRARAHALGLEVWGDLQVGVSDRDHWGHPAAFLPDYALGAPPSRTNPEGQAWGYPVFDPSRADVTAFVELRAAKAFAEYDGVRVDHPQGLVSPWVYRHHADPARALAAVRGGARLFDTPLAADHPALARFAIARADQVNPDPATARWADDWLVALDEAQVARYAALLDLLLAAARRHGRGASAVACEVLSTCPYPLRRVLERHGVGRFRVTQKARLSNPASVYRSENAEPADWVMLGTHDTEPIWRVVERWVRDGTAGERARYLAWRLEPDERRRDACAAALAADPARLAQAQFADLFASRARNVLVFFADAFGLRDLYNRPGVVSPENWVLRLPSDHRDRLAARLAADQALNLPAALATALVARGIAASRPDLQAALERDAAAWRRGALPA